MGGLDLIECCLRLLQQAGLGFRAAIDLLFMDGQERGMMDFLREPLERQVIFERPVVGHERSHTLPITLGALFAMFLEALFNVRRGGAKVFHGAPAPFGDVWPDRPPHPLQTPNLGRAVRHHVHVGDTCRGHGDLAL
ncbi:hypothetical protein D3C75_708350 [compost metagenome]